MTQTRLISMLIVMVIVLAGCGGDSGDKLDPPKINYGTDMSEMGMPVTDARFTVAALPEGSDEWLLFDDIGEFLKYYQHESSAFQVMWVPDHNTEEFVHAEDAWYVQADQFCYSPMKWCVAAFADEESAAAASDEFDGEMWNWETVFDADWSQAPTPVEHSH
ncbi:MAG: hypothetical protein KC435_02920 [Thermomicrobiales bacterium]|nr:hypothetical protein [Thermomicrobiales bacterium]